METKQNQVVEGNFVSEGKKDVIANRPGQRKRKKERKKEGSSKIGPAFDSPWIYPGDTVPKSRRALAKPWVKIKKTTQERLDPLPKGPLHSTTNSIQNIIL